MPPLQVELGSSLGGPYLAVHLRRKDFTWGHRDDVPSLERAVRKIRSLMRIHGLDRVFVATDAVRTGGQPWLCRPLAPVVSGQTRMPPDPGLGGPLHFVVLSPPPLCERPEH